MERPDKILSLDLKPVARDIVRQMKALVPVRTGRLQKSIHFNIERNGAVYKISLIMEDYYKWLKPRTKPLPTRIELNTDPESALPKMNNLGNVALNELSPRSYGIMQKLDTKYALSQIDLSALRTTILDIIHEDLEEGI